MYKRALAGEITNFTGVNDPYEPPHAPEVLVNTGKETPTASAARILRKLEQLELIPPRKSVYRAGVLLRTKAK